METALLNWQMAITLTPGAELWLLQDVPDTLAKPNLCCCHLSSPLLCTTWQLFLTVLCLDFYLHTIVSSCGPEIL